MFCYSWYEIFDWCFGLNSLDVGYFGILIDGCLCIYVKDFLIMNWRILVLCDIKIRFMSFVWLCIFVGRESGES